MKIYYTIPTHVSQETYSDDQGFTNVREHECKKILKILNLYYEINKELLPQKTKERLEEILDCEDWMSLEEEDFDIIAPILEKFLYNDGKIKGDQIVGLLLDSCYNLNYLTLTADYAYSFQAGIIPQDVKKVYYFSQYKELLHPCVWHIYNNTSTDFIIDYEGEWS